MNNTKDFVFMMGAAGAGKTTVAAALFPEHEKIDPDEIKEAMPGFVPACAPEFHEESQAIAERYFQFALSEGGKWLLDSTGANTGKLFRRILEAKSNGFKVTLVYVIVSLDTALDRAAARERFVSPEYIARGVKNLDSAFQLVEKYVDETMIVFNE